MEERSSSWKSHDFTSWVQNKKGWAVLLVLLIALLLVYFLKYHFAKSPPSEPSFPVVTDMVKKKDIPVYLSGLGNVTATYTITVRTQVNGLLMKVYFKEGQNVKKNDLLAEIDQRPLLAQLTQYQGQLARDQALLENALIDLKRYQRLWKQDSISQQTLATQESLVRQYQGAMEVDKGLIESTKVNLLYTKIIAPVDGRVGLRLVDPGNFVQTSDTNGLVVLTTVNPITVIFSLPGNDLSHFLPKIHQQKAVRVEALNSDQKEILSVGTLLAVDNQIDVTTGTVKLRANFANKDHRLFPNQFVNIRLFVELLKNAVVVNSAAIQHDNKGDFVFLVGSDHRVQMQTVKTGLTAGDETIILAGLKYGQSVVVDGADKLSNGVQVTVSDQSNQAPSPKQSANKA